MKSRPINLEETGLDREEVHKGHLVAGLEEEEPVEALLERVGARSLVVEDNLLKFNNSII